MKKLWLGNTCLKSSVSFVAKGSKICGEGKLQTLCWEDGQSGGRKYRTEIIAVSSRIYGTQSPFEDVSLFDNLPHVEAMQCGLRRLAGGFPLSPRRHSTVQGDGQAGGLSFPPLMANATK